MTNRNIEDLYPLSPMQQGMLFHALYAPETGVYVEQTTCTLRGDLNVAAFRQAWQRVIDRHAILRTAFVWEEVEEPLQVVQRKVEVPLAELDWRGAPPAEQARRVDEFCRSDRARGLDLGQPPLLRLTLIRLADDVHELVWTHHHTLLDGWSLPILLKEVLTFYEAISRGKPAALPATRPYRDYIAWLKKQDAAAAERFWREALAGFAEPTPLPLARPADPTQPAAVAEQETWLDAATTAELQALARSQQVTMNTLVGAAWGLLLSRYAGVDDVVFGATVSGRPADLRGAEAMVGLFINTLPVRLRIDPAQSLAALLRAVQTQQVELRQYEYTPLVQVQGWSDVPRDRALFDTILIFENYPADRALSEQLSSQGAQRSLSIENVRSHEQTNYPLTFVSGVARELMLKISYDVRSFDDDAVGRMLGHLRTLLEAMPAALERPVAELPLLTAAEERQLLVDWNATALPWPDDRPVHQLFEAQAERTPDAVAVIAAQAGSGSDPGPVSTLTYAELNARANQLAHHLVARGVQPGELVGLFVERSPEMVVGLLGILKAGGAYLPLDPAYPAERLAYMTDDAGIRVLVTQQGLGRDEVAHGHREAVYLDADWPIIAQHPGGHSPQQAAQAPASHAAALPTANQPAYVIYTSGSTGLPKGVVVSHANLANHARALAQVMAIGPGDRMLQFITVSFDAAGEEFWPTLISGAALVLPGEERDRLGEALAAFCERHEVTHLHMPASVWHQWCDDLATVGRRLSLPLKLLLVGGESPSTERLAAWNRLLPAPCRFVNGYGPTEATITCTLYQTTSDATLPARLPIGRPIVNAQVYVVDTAMRPVPLGVPGELLIGGAGVAQGYLNRPDLTNERFVPNPFVKTGPVFETGPVWGETGKTGPVWDRLYRTGDLVRWLPDGNLEFLGRVDEQVKVRGFRVEPGEVEAALEAMAEVKQAAVVARDHNGTKQLVAYVVGEGDEPVDLETLRAALRRRLPDYMVPAAWMRLPSLPMTPSGKVDRRSLPAPDYTAAGPAFVAPRTPEEELLAEIIGDLLRVERVGAHDSFFELGGHSLLATRLASRVREVFGVDLSLRTLFDAPTVAGMAAAVVAARAGRDGAPPAMPPIARLPRSDDGRGLPVEPPPLSFGQQRLWFLDQLEPGLLSYNTPAALRLHGRLDVDALRRSLNEIARRHEVLRTTFGTVGGKPVQMIAAEMTVDLPVEDLTAVADPVARETEALRLAAEEARKPFDLATGPILRGRLIRLAEDDHIAVITIHHIAADGWSLGVLVGELAALYEAFGRGGDTPPLPPLPIQYADYAAWQRTWLEGTDEEASPLQQQLAYWREQLAGLPPRLELPTDRPRPAVQTSNGSVYNFHLPADLSDKLQKLSREEGSTLFMTLLAAYQTLLARYANQGDVAVGSVVANRNRPELEGLIGFFVNTLVFRTRFDGHPSFRELLARVRETVLGAFAHQDVPFEMLVDAVQPERDLSHTPLFQAAFSLQNTPMPAAELPGLTLRAVNIDRGSAQFDMLLTMSQTPDGLAAAWEYNSDLFDRSTIERMASHLHNLLAAAVADPDQPALSLPLLGADERRQMLVAWNDTAVPFPADTTIHALFEAQAAAQPDAPAAIFAVPGGSAQTLSYGELDRRANQLANYLRSLGADPHTLVALLVERSLDMLVGILGVLKAGAAYLPVDPAYPADRIEFMLSDSAAPLILTQAHLQERLSAGGAANEGRTTVCLDADWPTIAKHPERPNPIGGVALPGPDTPAYCIYTSGSTGRPKGALLRHRGLCNLADVQQRAFDMRPGKRVLQFSPLSFDASVWEWAMALRSGATLVLTRQEVLASGPELMKLLAEQRITTVTLPPSLLAVLQPEQLPDLETVIAAGERCTNEIVAKWATALPPRQGLQASSFPSLPPTESGRVARAFFNAYGPTETTVCASMFRCDPSVVWPFGGPPIGGPIANFQLYVVDDRMQPQPVGVPGELLIGGVGLAVGYLNRPELTTERFVPNPFAPKDVQTGPVLKTGPVSDPVSDRLYRTGDLVRWLPNGVLEYIGRIDDQVKVRGFRIELGEIEAALRDHPAVQDAVATARGDTLAAYFILAPGADGDATTAAALKAHLRQRLPEYMVPATFTALDAFPRSPAGKVDRRLLPAPDQTARLATVYVAPRTPAEETLAALCAELLNLERVGMEDNFFELGGHSLLATQLISRIRDEFQVELPLRVLFEQPTVAGLAQAVEQARVTQAAPTAAPQAPALTARSRAGRKMSLAQLGDESASSGPTGTRGGSA